jgi:glycosyltransferase involved in cell wall biosynthesis
MATVLTNIGAVVIGRNEGERLKLCLTSLATVGVVIYVDSGSTDESAQWARGHGADVIELDMGLPFTAARARNCGFRRLQEISFQISYVQFVDGDCELVNGWLATATSFLDSHAQVAAVYGRRRERFPERSIYNWLCDREWEGEAGEAYFFGGDVMIRIDAFKAVDGYREDMIAGEEPELSVRLRARGWQTWRLDAEMTLHDAAITRFGQWWKRNLRSGYAFAHGAYLHGTSSEHTWVWESRRAWIWGVWLPLGCLTAGLLFGPWGWATWLIFPLQILRQVSRNTGPLKQRVRLALFHLLGRFPEAAGQIKFMLDRLLGRRSGLIEYK